MYWFVGLKVPSLENERRGSNQRILTRRCTRS